MAIKLKSMNINLPFGIGGVTIDVDETQQRAAWSLYVELATRVAGVGLEPGTGSAREALSSLHSIFETTRGVLRDAGPDVAKGPESLGPLAIEILNTGLRPFVVKWHSRLSAFERQQTDERRQQFGGKSAITIDESRWESVDDFYTELAELRNGMLTYVTALAHIAGVHHGDDDIGGNGA